MSSLTTYNGLQVVTPEPAAAGGKAINDNFKIVSTKIDTTDPTPSDDSTLGYGVGSRWFNETTQVEQVCTDNTAGSAVWIPVFIEVADGQNIPLGTSTGTKIGTATNQLLGFYGAIPVTQQTGGAATAGPSYTSIEQGMLNSVYAALQNLGLIS